MSLAFMLGLILTIASAAPAASATSPAVPAAGVAAPADTATAPPGEERSLQDRFHEADSLIALSGGSRADRARLLLTWNAPYGMARAATEHQGGCAEGSANDTLYLSFLPGRSTPNFNGMTTTLLLHAAPGDTLGPFWQLEHDGLNSGGLAVEFGPDPSFGILQPWAKSGMGHVFLDRTRQSARLRMIYAVGMTDAGPVNGDSIYCLARVIFRRPHGALAGCSQPVCFEWSVASLAYGLKDEPNVNRGERFVSWNSPRGAVCEPFRSAAGTQPWRPPGRGAGSSP